MYDMKSKFKKIIITIIIFSSSSFSRYIPNTGSRTGPKVSVSPVNCLKEVTESATLNPL